MASISARLRVSSALRAKLPPASRYDVNPGDAVFVYKEAEKRWKGPFRVVKVADKQVYVDRNGVEAHYSLDHVLPERAVDGEGLIRQIHVGFASLTSLPPPQVFLTEVLHPRDSRGRSSQFEEAKLKEIEGLVKRGTYEVVLKEDVPVDANILGGRFVLSIKNKDTNEEKFKARFVVQGHTDREKNILVHSSTNLRQSSIRTITALAAIFGLRVWSQDVSQAYLQSAERLMREVYVKPAKEFRLSSEHLLKLLRPLYGLADSGDYWHVTMARHLTDDLTMTPTALDVSLFFKTVRNQLSGLTGVYVDDSIHAGDVTFFKETDKTMAKFESRPRDMDKFTFAGIEVDTTPFGIRLHQRSYALKITSLSADCSFTDFRSKRQQLQWLTHTRPDIAYAVNRASQVTEKSFASRHVKDFNKIVTHVRDNPGKGLLQRRLDTDSLHLRVYTDSSFANNEDLSTQLGYLVLLCDARKRCNILHYSSHKSRRVVRSVMGGEVYAFADGFDFGITIRHDLQRIIGKKLSLSIFTDSKCLFDVITKHTTTTEKRLMIDIKAVREAYERMEISDVGWIRSKDNPADALTKLTENAVLETIIRDGFVDHDISQWIVRTAQDNIHDFHDLERGECRESPGQELVADSE